MSSSQDVSSGVITRRRDKRRHVSTDTIDMSDPCSTVSLAVRIDESHGEESLLHVPLETGRINGSQKSFVKALQALRKRTSLTRQSISSFKTSRKKGDPSKQVAITPVILSGLLAIMDIEDQEDNENGHRLTRTELIAYCQSMRRAAVARIRARKQKRRIQRIVAPLILVGSLIFLYFWITSNLKGLLIEFGFVDSCKDTSYLSACRLAEAELWNHIHLPPFEDCTMESCSVDGHEEYPFYAMHTMVRQEWIHLDEIEVLNKRNKPKSWSFRKSTSQTSPLQWLGETTVNRLVRESLFAIQQPSSSIKLLDVGCGIGGTLYSLLQSKIEQERLTYHGISISAPEIHQALRQRDIHQLESSKFVFERKNFDDFLGQTFSAMVAIESLSFSPELNLTLKNLAAALQSRGTLIIVDDVVTPWAKSTEVQNIRKATGRSSLLTHKEWKQVLSSSGFAIKEVRDIGLEMDIPELLSAPEPNIWGFLMGWRHRTSEFLLKKWSKWYENGATIEQRASLRMVQLVQDFVQRARGATLRQEAYREADLSYYMYICIKQ